MVYTDPDVQSSQYQRGLGVFIYKHGCKTTEPGNKKKDKTQVNNNSTMVSKRSSPKIKNETESIHIQETHFLKTGRKKKDRKKETKVTESFNQHEYPIPRNSPRAAAHSATD